MLKTHYALVVIAVNMLSIAQLNVSQHQIKAAFLGAAVI